MARHCLVISHERSGTHFLINSLSCNFDYQQGRIDMDGVNGDFSFRKNIHDFVRKILREFKEPCIIKSHHPLIEPVN